MRVALYGGTFNPPHKGHRKVAEEVFRLLKVDQIIVIPAYQNPLKESEELVSSEHRLKMVQLNFEGIENLSFSDVELSKERICYTIDTVRELKYHHPEWTETFFVIGSDSALGIEAWKDFNELLDEVTVVVAGRPGFKLQHQDKRLVCIENEEFDASSEELRKGLREGGELTSLENNVLNYIRKNELYTK